MLLPSPYQQCNFISALLMGHTVCDLIEYNAGTCQHQENWTYVLLCWGDPGQALRPAQHPLAVSPQCDGGENEKRKSKTTGGLRSSRLLSEGKRKVKGQSLPWCSASLWSAPTGQTSDFIAEQDAQDGDPFAQCAICPGCDSSQCLAHPQHAPWGAQWQTRSWSCASTLQQQLNMGVLSALI